MTVSFTPRDGRGRWSAAAVTGWVLLLASLTGCASAVAPPPAPTGPPAAAAPAPLVAPDEQAADPVRIRIPAIGVDAAVGPLDVDAANVLIPPSDYDVTGWWRDGPEPGETGAAVIAGHVDSRSGPAVFYRLPDLPAGEQVMVDLADGSTATYVARRTEKHAKAAFPTDAVYAPVPDAQLRLITCGGAFDTASGHYRDNVIVYADLTGQ